MSVVLSKYRGLLGLIVLAAVAGVLIVAGSGPAAATGGTRGGLPPPNNVQQCQHGDPVVIALAGLGTFKADLQGSVAARTGETFYDAAGLKTVPLQILGTSSRDFAAGLGEVMVWLDHSRPVPGSLIRQNAVGSDFPATQHMRFHIFIETEALPGKRFRSINPLHVRSGAVDAFPPRVGTRYRLVAPVELEDVDEPGVVAMKVLSGAPVILGSRPG